MIVNELGPAQAPRYRAIEPLPDTQQRITHGGIIAPRPTFCSVRPASLLVDESYQRSLSERSEKMIRDIVRDWSWASYKAPIVVETAAGMVVIDGQHTAIAATTRGIEFIPVLVVAADSVEDQAKAFLGHNTRRVAITAMQIFRAAVTAGDEDALTAKQVCDRARVKIMYSKSGREPFGERETVAVGAITALAKKHGAKAARQILEAVADAGVTPIKALHIRAAEILMRDPAYAEKRMSFEELTVTLASLRQTEDLEVKTTAASMKISSFEALALVLHRRRKAVATTPAAAPASRVATINTRSTPAEALKRMAKTGMIG